MRRRKRFRKIRSAPDILQEVFTNDDVIEPMTSTVQMNDVTMRGDRRGLEEQWEDLRFRLPYPNIDLIFRKLDYRNR